MWSSPSLSLYGDAQWISIFQESVHWVEGGLGLLPLQTFNPSSLLSPTCTPTLQAAWCFYFLRLPEARHAGLIGGNGHLTVSIIPSQMPLWPLCSVILKKC